jgi:enoyl-CoA hydratase
MNRTTASSKVTETWRDGALMVIAIRRPDDANRTNSAVMRAIAEALDESDADPAIRVVALTGNRDYFSHGGRIDGYAEGDVHRQIEFGRAFTALQVRMATSNKPLIAVVEGHCVCGGMSLVDACDLAVAADDVRFGFAEIEAGIFPFLARATFYGRLPSIRHRLPADSLRLRSAGCRFILTRSRLIPNDLATSTTPKIHRDLTSPA